ncbi:MAG: CHAP domain-containing protein [Elusimicrobiota bacterium]|jgi:hypothetical protein
MRISIIQKAGRILLSGSLIFTISASRLAGADKPGVNAVALSPDVLRINNPYNGRHRHCAAFARYGLYLMTGKRYTTYGSARRWAYHAKTLRATVPLAMVQPGNLLFFRDSRSRINHVAIVLETDYRDGDGYEILFQDERGTHSWIHRDSTVYLGMVPVFGADITKLETVAI